MAIQPFPFSPSYGVNPQATPVTPTQTAPIIPEGLLGSTPDYRSLLGDANRFAGQQGLYATLMGLARPVRRGESRLMGAMQMGQQAAQAARQQKMGELSTQMKLDEMDRARKRQAMEQAFMRGDMEPAGSAPAIDLETGFSSFQLTQMSPAQKQSATEAIRLENRARRAASLGMNDFANQLRNDADNLRESALADIRPEEKQIDLEIDRRDKFQKAEVTPRLEQVEAANQLAQLAANPSAITDVATIFKFLKVLDPGSVVREGEQAMLQRAQSLFGTLKVYAESLESGATLSPQQRKQIVDAAYSMAGLVQDDYALAVQRQRDLAKNLELRPEVVIPMETLPLRERSSFQSTTGAVQNPAGALRQSRIRTRGGVGQ